MNSTLVFHDKSNEHSPFCTTFGLGRNLSTGNSLSPPMYTLSSGLKLPATMPGSILTVKYTSLMGPRISSTLPICDLFWRLQNGTLSRCFEACQMFALGVGCIKKAPKG